MPDQPKEKIDVFSEKIDSIIKKYNDDKREKDEIKPFHYRSQIILAGFNKKGLKSYFSDLRTWFWGVTFIVGALIIGLSYYGFKPNIKDIDDLISLIPKPLKFIGPIGLIAQYFISSSYKLAKNKIDIDSEDFDYRLFKKKSPIYSLIKEFVESEGENTGQNLGKLVQEIEDAWSTKMDDGLDKINQENKEALKKLELESEKTTYDAVILQLLTNYYNEGLYKIIDTRNGSWAEKDLNLFNGYVLYKIENDRFIYSKNYKNKSRIFPDFKIDSNEDIHRDYIELLNSKDYYKITNDSLMIRLDGEETWVIKYYLEAKSIKLLRESVKTGTIVSIDKVHDFVGIINQLIENELDQGQQNEGEREDLYV